MTKYRTRAYVYLVLVSIIWGVATPVVKVTLGGIAPLPFLTYRFAVSSFMAIPFLIKTGVKKIIANAWEVGLYSFLTTTFALGVLFFGIEKTTVVDTALITAVGPLVTAVAGYYLLKEHITKRERVGIALAFSGTLVTIVEPLVEKGLDSSQLRGNLLVLGYIFVMSLASVMSKRLVRKKVDPFALTHVSFIIGFVTLLPFTLYLLPYSELITQITTLSINYHLGVLYMAILSGTIAYALWTKAQKSIEISEAGVFAYLIPIFAAPLGVVWLKETISVPFVIGAILIATGVIIAERKRKET